ncbi:MAG: RNA-binding protein [Nanoarchaeota archaeon]
MKVYVGNLSFAIDNNKLNELFSEFGGIEEAIVIVDKFSGRSKGFGFVTFKDDDSAKKAISEMNDKEVEGRKLKVNEAKPMDPDRPRPPRRDFGGRGFGGGGGSGSGGGGRRFGGSRDRF